MVNVRIEVHIDGLALPKGVYLLITFCMSVLQTLVYHDITNLLMECLKSPIFGLSFPQHNLTWYV
jgi:hypothetical protein